MFDFADPCATEDSVCNWVYERTDNQSAAWFADWLIGLPLALLGLLLLGFVIRWILHRLVDRLVKRAESGMIPARVHRLSLGSLSAGKSRSPQDIAVATRRVQRAKTMGTLLKSIITGIVVAVVATMMLAEVGVNVGPIIASAGILGIALGFGAQSLVSDFLSGVFMIVEDQYGVGDVIDVGEARGTVEGVSLRTTRLRDVEGVVWHVPNGEIKRVGNMSQQWSRALLDIGIAYDTDVPTAIRVIKDTADAMWRDEKWSLLILAEPEVWGVEELGADRVIIRLVVQTRPLEQWRVARELRARIKREFDVAGIELPLPQQTITYRTEPPPVANAGGDTEAGD